MERKGLDAETLMRCVSKEENMELDELLDRCTETEEEVIREATGWSNLSLHRRRFTDGVTVNGYLKEEIPKIPKISLTKFRYTLGWHR